MNLPAGFRRKASRVSSLNSKQRAINAVNKLGDFEPHLQVNNMVKKAF